VRKNRGKGRKRGMERKEKVRRGGSEVWERERGVEKEVIQIQNCLAHTNLLISDNPQISALAQDNYTLSINSPHSPTRFLRPANLTTYKILSLFSLHAEPAPHRTV